MGRTMEDFQVASQLVLTLPIVAPAPAETRSKVSDGALAQATNDNLRLLYDFHAADFSLAPLPHDQQLKLIDEFIKAKGWSNQRACGCIRTFKCQI